jgi:hypothetical protein
MQEKIDSSMINFAILKALDGILQELEGDTGVGVSSLCSFRPPSLGSYASYLFASFWSELF